MTTILPHFPSLSPSYSMIPENSICRRVSSLRLFIFSRQSIWFRSVVINSCDIKFRCCTCSGKTEMAGVFGIQRRGAISMAFSSYMLTRFGGVADDIAIAKPGVVFNEFVDTFDGYSFNYPQNWLQVKGAGADISFRSPLVLDENISIELSSPSSSRYKSVLDLGSPQKAGENVLRQYLTEFMSTRLGVKRESSVLSTSSRTADDGRTYYEVEANIKSFANNNEMAVMPQNRVAKMEWNRRYLSVLGVENSRLYELRLQIPEKIFAEEESDLRRIMDSFRVIKVAADT